MKRTMILTAVILSGFLFQPVHAQLKVNVNINLGRQPVWGPTGYDQANYYYLPDIDCYYDVNNSRFIYNSGNRWVFASKLPPQYSSFDLYNGYKVVVNEPKPYLHADVYRAKYRNNHPPHEKQMAIRDSKEEKYYEVKGHPMHQEWAKKHGHDHDHNGKH